MVNRFKIVWSKGYDFHKAVVSDGRVVIASYVKDQGWFVFVDGVLIQRGIKTRMSAVRIMRKLIFKG